MCGFAISQTGAASATITRICIWNMSLSDYQLDGINTSSASNNCAWWISVGF